MADANVMQQIKVQAKITESLEPSNDSEVSYSTRGEFVLLPIACM